MGQSKLDDALLVELVSALETLPVPLACDLVGITAETYRRWIKWGEEGEEPYASFTALAKASRAAYVQQRLIKIREAERKDWKAAAWYLERSFPGYFARTTNEKTELSGPGGGPIALALGNVAGLTDDELGQLERLLSKAASTSSGSARSSGAGAG